MADHKSHGQATEFVSQTGRSKLKILVVGKTGVGKSALINALVGYEVSPESSMEAGTFNVEKIEAELHAGIEVTFFDSPGLHDAKGNEKEYLQQIIDNCHDLDLVLFCTKLTDTRVTEEDCDTICEFTSALGKDFWKNSVFVLTFANNVRPKTNIHDPEMKRKTLKEKIHQLTKKLREVLQSKGKVPSQVVKKILFVPAGYYTPEHQILPDGSHWFSCFWAACFTRVRDTGRPAIINGCLDMFEVENEKSKLKSEQPLQYESAQAANNYPMPVLSHPQPHQPLQHYQALVPAQYSRRSIPMRIHIPDSPEFGALPTLIKQAATTLIGGIPGMLVSLFVDVSTAILKTAWDSLSDDEDD